MKDNHVVSNHKWIVFTIAWLAPIVVSFDYAKIAIAMYAVAVTLLVIDFRRTK